METVDFLSIYVTISVQILFVYLAIRKDLNKYLNQKYYENERRNAKKATA